MNELFVELQRVTKTELSSGVEPDQMAKEATDTTTFNDPEPPLILNSVTCGKSSDALNSVPIHSHSIGGDFVDLDSDYLASKSSMRMATGEIEQIPLPQFDDRNRNRELPATEIDEKDVLLSDAPLIGAPYRLISFMAKYVSGADLVGKS